MDVAAAVSKLRDKMTQVLMETSSVSKTVNNIDEEQPVVISRTSAEQEGRRKAVYFVPQLEIISSIRTCPPEW